MARLPERHAWADQARGHAALKRAVSAGEERRSAGGELEGHRGRPADEGAHPLADARLPRHGQVVAPGPHHGARPHQEDERQGAARPLRRQAHRDVRSAAARAAPLRSPCPASARALPPPVPRRRLCPPLTLVFRRYQVPASGRARERQRFPRSAGAERCGHGLHGADA